MTRLPDVTTQREIAPATSEFDNQALLNLAMQFPEQAAPLISSIKSARDLATAPKEDFITLSEGQIAVGPTSGRILTGREKQKEITNDRDAISFAEFGGRRFSELNPQEAKQVNNILEGSKVKVASAGAAKSVAPRKIDEKFADQFIDWTVGGGFSDVQKSLTQLGSAAQTLEASPEGTITGKLIGKTPSALLDLVNPKAVATKEAVEEVVQRNLRLILGAQFTEKEGERLIARAYNPALGQKENARRIRLLQEQISDAAQAKQDAVEYYNRNGTISGWQGKVFNNTTDFLNEYNKRLTGKKTTLSAPAVKAPSGVDPQVWNFMSPEEKALWQN
jgi:hypothetical protein